MLQSIVRYLVVSLFAYLVGHHVITQDIANANTAAWTNYAVIGLSVVAAIVWSYLEKRYKGVLTAYFPSSLGRTPPSGGVSLLLAAGLVAGCVLSGCATTAGESSTLSAAESYAWSLANALETKNTASGVPLDESLAQDAEQAAGLSGPKTTVYTNIGTALVNAAIQAGQAVAAHGGSGTAIQAAQTAVLSDPGVIDKAVSAGSTTTPAFQSVPVITGS
jgi:hypothetical protein